MTKEKSERVSILVSVFFIMLIFLLLNQFVTHELYLSSADYEEVCNEWETVENYRLILH